MIHATPDDGQPVDPRTRIPDPLAPPPGPDLTPGMEFAAAAPRLKAQLQAALQREPTLEEQRAELVELEQATFEAMVAITHGTSAGLIHLTGLTTVDGQPTVELVLKQHGKLVPWPFRGPTLADAFILAGSEVHGQLMLLHGATGKLKDYVHWHAMRRKLRKAPSLIVKPSGS